MLYEHGWAPVIKSECSRAAPVSYWLLEAPVSVNIGKDEPRSSAMTKTGGRVRAGQATRGPSAKMATLWVPLKPLVPLMQPPWRAHLEQGGESEGLAPLPSRR